MRMKDEQISVLENDVYYYKHKKQELESHVKELVMHSEALVQEQQQQQIQQQQMQQQQYNSGSPAGAGKITSNPLHSVIPRDAVERFLVAIALDTAHAIRISRSQMQRQLETGQLRPVSREELLARRGGGSGEPS